MTPLVHVDVFSGIGGFALAAAATGFETRLFCEIEPFCQRALAHHWPEVAIHDDARTLTPATLAAAGVTTVDLLTGGVPCFAAGTLILTRDGFRPIQDVRVGNEVLSHRGHWRMVTAVHERSDAPLRKVSAMGVPGVVTTDDHPFYARRVSYRWDNDTRQNARVIAEPRWIDACCLTEDDMLGQVLPPVGEDQRPCAFWWVVGRYLADGWRVKRSGRASGGRVVICCAHDEADSLANRIADAGFHASRVDERTVVKYHIHTNAFYVFLHVFGSSAHGKLLPGSVFELDQTRAWSLLDGYLSGDGYRETSRTGQGRMATTTSKALALSMALLAQRAYGTVGGVRLCPMPSTKTIEGRVVNQRDFFKVTIADHNRVAFVEGNYGWKRINQKASYPCGTGTVFNISVADDESYIADGAIVHNCQPVSIAGRRRGTDDERWLWPAFLDIVCHAQPRWVVAENPCGLLSLADVRGVRVFPALLGALAALGYRSGWCCDGVDDVGAPHQRERVFIVAHREDREMADAAGQLDTSSRPGNARDVGEASDKTDRGRQKSVLDAVTHPGHTRAETDIKTVDWFGRAFGVGQADAKGAGRERGRKRGGTEASQSRSQHDGQNLAAQTGRRHAESGVGPSVARIPVDLVKHPRWPAGQGSFQYAWEAPRTISTTPERCAKLTAVGNSVSPQQAFLVLDPIARYERHDAAS